MKKIINKPERLNNPLNALLTKRFYELDNSKSLGLLNKIFTSLDENSVPEFGGGSLLIHKKEISQADLILCSAAALQNMRNGYLDNSKNNRKLKSTPPLYKILILDHYLKPNAGHFNEMLIVASVLRIGLHDELRARQSDNLFKQKEYILQLLNGIGVKDSEFPFFMYELYIALKLQKLPKPSVEKKLWSFLEKIHMKNDI